MGTSPAVVADVEARFPRPLTEAEQSFTQSLLDDAWSLALDSVADLEARYASGLVRPESAVRVLCAMVLRVLRNPEGKKQESIDDYSWTRDNAVSSGLLYLSDDERSQLGSALAGERGAFTIRPGR